jgi:hypothetical protein
LRGTPKTGRNRRIFSERIVNIDDVRVDLAVQTGSEKYYERADVPYAYFNLADDPGEKNNLLETLGKGAFELAKGLREYERANRKLADRKVGTNRVRRQRADEETLRKLRALGYVN